MRKESAGGVEIDYGWDMMVTRPTSSMASCGVTILDGGTDE